MENDKTTEKTYIIGIATLLVAAVAFIIFLIISEGFETFFSSSPTYNYNQNNTCYPSRQCYNLNISSQKKIVNIYTNYGNIPFYGKRKSFKLFLSNCLVDAPDGGTLNVSYSIYCCYPVIPNRDNNSGQIISFSEINRGVNNNIDFIPLSEPITASKYGTQFGTCVFRISFLVNNYENGKFWRINDPAGYDSPPYIVAERIIQRKNPEEQLFSRHNIGLLLYDPINNRSYSGFDPTLKNGRIEFFDQILPNMM
jgi:hypothetical protein